MDLDVTHGIAILERSPATLQTMSYDLGTAWMRAYSPIVDRRNGD